jgi:hypothetical protein
MCERKRHKELCEEPYYVFYRAIRHVEGDIMLPIPHIAALHAEGASTQALAKDPCLIGQLEETVTSWERHVTKTTDSYLAQVQRVEISSSIYFYTFLSYMYAI